MDTKNIIVVANLEHFQGYTTKGHIELIIDKEKWNNLTDEEKEEEIKHSGTIFIDGYEIEDVGPITNIKHYEC